VVQHLAGTPSAALLGSVGQELALHFPVERIAVFGADGRRIEVVFS
jgi:hypothetical protein